MEDLEPLLLGAPLTLTPEEVIEQAGVPEELADDVWAALGFPSIPDGVRAFTVLDVEALKESAALLQSGLVDVDTWLVMARTMGQALARLAEAQLDVFRQVSPDLSQEEAVRLAVDLGGEVVPRIERQMLYVWRRQFNAAAQRALAGQRDEAGLQPLAVAFVDLVDFTSSSRAWNPKQLGRTLETFERDVALRVAAVGGRVVKTLGDGVLFTTTKAADAVAIALDTVAAHEADDELPNARAGVACGPVLVRLGDVFGDPVNRASRLADEARPSSVLVDRATSGSLEGAEELTVRPLAKRSVRGFRSLTPFLVRRA